MTEGRTAIRARGLRVSYGERHVLRDVDLDVEAGSLTVIVGPNACGKSTLLRSLARMTPIAAGDIELDGERLLALRSRELAKRVSMLPQNPVAPDGLLVEDLVARGRYPHQGILRQWSKADEEATEDAMRLADVGALRRRDLAELSGGQRQRVWIAMTLAQATPIVLLDEPTTYLDLAHQLDVLDLARTLQREGKTVVLVLHELSLAFRYATDLVVMHAGQIIAHGAPSDIVSAELIHRVFDVECSVIEDPVSGTPLVIPHERITPRAASPAA